MKWSATSFGESPSLVLHKVGFGSSPVAHAALWASTAHALLLAHLIVRAAEAIRAGSHAERTILAGLSARAITISPPPVCTGSFVLDIVKNIGERLVFDGIAVG